MKDNPICRKCREEIYPTERAKLGYDTCLNCGDKRKQYTIAPAYNKGSYQLITPDYVKDIGKK
jgi:ribosomal protein L37AE/L43A